MDRYDLVIRNGMVIDGSGFPAYRADVGVVGDRIARIGRIRERGAEEIDAESHVVTPGFIDGHTHMDAQAFWDPIGSCSCWHGVTTAVMGNCGFSIAPTRPGGRDLVIRNLERAEDISAKAMELGIPWNWEHFTDYMDVVDKLPKGINHVLNIGHSALRTWAMGERAFTDKASEDEVRLMEAEVRAAIRAGAIGFTTSRSLAHPTADGSPVASRLADWSEVRRLVAAVAEAGGGVFEIANDFAIYSDDIAARDVVFNQLKDLALETRVPITFGVMPDNNWRERMGLIEQTTAAGGRMYAQIHSREIAVLYSFKSFLPFDELPEWAEIRALPLEAQRAALTDPAHRARLVEAAKHGDYQAAMGAGSRPPEYEWIRILKDAVQLNPTVAEVAEQTGRHPVDVMIDLALETNFEQFFAQVYAGKIEAGRRELLRHPLGIMTFSDSGAHVSQIMDSSIQTHLLAYWVRERGLLTLEEAIRLITNAPAVAWGFHDRGLLRVGMVADLNVIDPVTVEPQLPQVVNDLPGGARRLVQKSAGMLATVVAGKVFMRGGEHTGALAGRLLRGDAHVH
jgi:N-acyl-D-aspartate/D-glutamate deacylase